MALEDRLGGPAPFGLILQYHFFAVALWGPYTGISLHLLFDRSVTSADRKLVRVIIFAVHPERFFYECGLEAARTQDLKLNAAAEITLAKVEKDFFQSCATEYGRSWDSTEDKELSKISSLRGRSLDLISLSNSRSWLSCLRTTFLNPCSFLSCLSRSLFTAKFAVYAPFDRNLVCHSESIQRKTV